MAKSYRVKTTHNDDNFAEIEEIDDTPTKTVMTVQELRSKRQFNNQQVDNLKGQIEVLRNENKEITKVIKQIKKDLKLNVDDE